MKSQDYEIHLGDCRDSLRAMAARGERVQMCVTSPPYFGLRDYGHDGQIGLEQTPEEYIAAMVEVFQCVRDVLADDGTLWVNIGDSYASNAGGYDSSGSRGSTSHPSIGKGTMAAVVQNRRRLPATGLKPKDLIGIPWMLAFALRADGWYLRQDIIWHKPNPMPESVRDRCTKAHEYVFLLSKSGRYFYNAEAVEEPVTGNTSSGAKRPSTLVGRNASTTQGGKLSSGLGMAWTKSTRNRRSVWTIATRPYKGAHFATFPPDLAVPCVLAGSRPGDTILDPFGGSGTTAGVAVAHGRRAVLCELNPEYAALVPGRVASIIEAHGKAAKQKRPRRPAPVQIDLPGVAA